LFVNYALKGNEIIWNRIKSKFSSCFRKKKSNNININLNNNVIFNIVGETQKPEKSSFELIVDPWYDQTFKRLFGLMKLIVSILLKEWCDKSFK